MIDLFSVNWNIVWGFYSDADLASWIYLKNSDLDARMSSYEDRLTLFS